jgi:hypothetical protein
MATAFLFGDVEAFVAIAVLLILDYNDPTGRSWMRKQSINLYLETVLYAMTPSLKPATTHLA